MTSMIVDVSTRMNMATTSESSASLQDRKGDRKFRSKGGKREAPEFKRRDSHGARKRPAREAAGGGNVKRKWRPNPNTFQGGMEEGRGFAFWRKKQAELQYKKLQRRQKKANNKDIFSDHYPEHLKHLYLAEEERLKSLEKPRRPQNKPSETEVTDERLKNLEEPGRPQNEPEERRKSPEKSNRPETKPSKTEDEAEDRLKSAAKPSRPENKPEVIPKKTLKKKTSNLKAKEVYERIQQERAKKREEAELKRKQREEAQKLYQQKRAENYKIISSKTKRGQPNFNLQMELLLQKIQSKS